MINPIFILVIASIFTLLIIFFGVRIYNMITQKKLQKKYPVEEVKKKEVYELSQYLNNNGG